MAHEFKIDQIICMDALKWLRTVPDSFIDLVMTSPPYWALRSYGVDGQLGQEDSFQEYIEKLLSVTSELKRTLKPMGSFYLNIADVYSGSGQGAHGIDRKNMKVERLNSKLVNPPSLNASAPRKSLCGIPWRLALRMIDEQGWILRNAVIWFKPNRMPSSVRDRLSNSYEFIFHFVRNERYYYDLDSIREPHQYPKDDARRIQQDKKGGVKPFRKGKGYWRRWRLEEAEGIKRMGFRDPHRSALLGGLISGNATVNPKGKNPGDFLIAQDHPPIGTPEYANWYFNERKKKGFHDHKFDQEMGFGQQKRGHKIPNLIHPFGKNPGDVFTTKPNSKYAGISERVGSIRARSLREGYDAEAHWYHEGGANPGDTWKISTRPSQLKHAAIYPEELCIRPIKSSCPENGLVCDPFAGTGTTLVAARKLGRHFLGCDINPEYVEMARSRVNQGRLEAFLG